jgi:hypothetical protein
MNIEREPTQNVAVQDHVMSELKSDFRYSLFYLLPKIWPGRDWRQIAVEIQLPENQAEIYARDLVAAGFWRLEGDQILITKEQFDLGDLQISEFLSTSLSLLAHMNVNGPCWYDTLLVTTNEALKKEFYRKVNQALKELVTESSKIQADTVLAWSHSGLDCLKALRERNP